MNARAARPRRLARILLLSAVGFEMVACGRSTGRSALPTGTLFVGPSRIALHVEIADTEPSRERGLMGRRSLAPDSGMAFLFGRPVNASFYMKDTLIPLSIAFWDPQDRVVAILDMNPCHADPCPLYSPGVPFIGAVEANQGFFRAHDVRIGDQVELER